MERTKFTKRRLPPQRQHEGVELPNKEELIARALPGMTNSKYDSSYVVRIFECAKIGMNQKEIEMALNVNTGVLTGWISNRTEIQEAWDTGRDLYSHGIQKSLFARATGYEYEEVKTVTGIDADGKSYSHVTTVIKRVPADVTAQIFWLKNMHKDKWADVHKQESVLTLNMQKTMKLEILSPEEQALVRSIAIKNLASSNDIGDPE